MFDWRHFLLVIACRVSFFPLCLLALILTLGLLLVLLVLPLSLLRLLLLLLLLFDSLTAAFNSLLCRVSSRRGLPKEWFKAKCSVE